MTYREYAKGNGHNDHEIKAMVGGLFGADAERKYRPIFWVRQGFRGTYRMLGLILISISKGGKLWEP